MYRRLVILAVAATCVLGACSDDDDGGGAFAIPGGGQATTVPGQTPAAGGAAYTQASHDNFVTECGNFPDAAADPGLCECAWTSITQTVPYDQYQAFEAAFAQGSTELPEWLTTAVSTCS
jgi:hypothetical protein